MDIIRRKPISTPQKDQPHKMQTVYPFDTQDKPLFITQKDLTAASQAEKHYQRGLRFKRALKIFLLLLAFFVLGSGAFLSWKTYKVSKKINVDPTKQTSFTQDMSSVLGAILPSKNHSLLTGEKEGRINILLLGAAGENNPGKNLTDTIMLMSIDTQNKKLALLSLPRDLYVKIPEQNYFTKINSVYPHGLAQGKGAEEIRQVVENITGIPVQYYLVVNFEGFTKLIDDIGGINVTAERDIFDTRYPGPNYSYETFELKKGFHNFDGATALKYVRERHDDPQGDFGRAARQQQVIQAVKNKLFSAQTLLNVATLSKLLDTLGDNIKTNIALDEMESFLTLAHEVDTQNINNVVIDAWQKDSLLKVSHVQMGPTRAFILLPRIGSYSEIQEVATNIFNQAAIRQRKEKLAAEKASITIFNQSSDPLLADKVQKLLKEKLGFEKVQIAHSGETTPREKTLVFDNTQSKKLYSLDELLKKIPATLADENDTLSKTGQETDFAILIGNDLISTYNYEEDSMADLQKADDNQAYLDFSSEKSK